MVSDQERPVGAGRLARPIVTIPAVIEGNPEIKLIQRREKIPMEVAGLLDEQNLPATPERREGRWPA
jgi:hypothetical protein